MIEKILEDGIKAQNQIIELESICGYDILTLKNMFLEGYELKKDNTRFQQAKLELEDMSHIPTLF